MKETTHDTFWKKHTDKVGIAGSVFAALCCLGFPALISIVSAVGLGFVINDAVLIPLLVIFLVLTLSGLYAGVRHHKRWLAFVVGAVSAMVLFISIVLAFSKPVAYLGIGGLIAASVLNVWLRANRKITAGTS